MSDLNPWQRVLAQVRLELDEEDFRRWLFTVGRHRAIVSAPSPAQHRPAWQNN